MLSNDDDDAGWYRAIVGAWRDLGSVQGHIATLHSLREAGSEVTQACLSAVTKHLFPFNVSNAHNVSLWTPINLTRRQNEQRMERPQRYQNYKKVDCLVTTTQHLLSCFLPLSLPCPDTITVVEELLEVDSFTSSSVPHLAFFQMADHRSVEGHQHLHSKYDRLRYKLRHSHFALVGSHHDDLPAVIRIKCRRLVFSISLPQMNN